MGGLVERARSALRGNPWIELAGRERVDIHTLVSPLRYDVLVRAAYFDFCEAQGDRIDRDPEAHLAASREHAYFVWFREVACAIRRPELLRDEAALARAFEARVWRSVALLRGFRSRGFDPTQKLTLASGRRILPTETGKELAGPLFAGDGCHRLALLLRDGTRHLEPSWYRVRVYWRHAPRDSTARLLGRLPLDLETYLAFVSMGYGEERFASAEALLARVGADAPARARELAGVLEVDLPRLRGHQEHPERWV